MVSTAAGIASTGLPVFVSSFAMFACGRAYEQIRNSVAYPRLNVKDRRPATPASPLARTARRTSSARTWL